MSDTDWITHAQCKGSNPEKFFRKDWQSVEDCKNICLLCPVRTPCYDLAANDTSISGVFGGHLFESGLMIEKHLPVGRPPKGGVKSWTFVPIPVGRKDPDDCR